MQDTPSHPELRFPADILQRASPRGNEYAWKRADLPRVLAAAEAAGLANLGGQVQFRAPAGTCELYWHSFESLPRRSEESAESFVRRSRREVETVLLRVPSDAELTADALAHFELLREQAAAGADVEEMLCFVCYFAVPD